MKDVKVQNGLWRCRMKEAAGSCMYKADYSCTESPAGLAGRGSDSEDKGRNSESQNKG